MMSEPTSRLSPDQVQTIARVLADPRRFAILKQIAQQATLTCSALDVKQCISPATISHHLKALQEADLIEVERQGRSARLTLRREVWNAYLQELASL
ncbi:MAG: ArsR/SmtB family transcription factor [Janthinobacterium lividum]